MTKKPKTITLDQWTKKYDREAKQHGWSLFDADGTITIQRIDESEEGCTQYKSDDEALRYVFAKAASGDRGCLLALYLDGKAVYAEGQTIPPFGSPATKLIQETHYLPTGI